MTEGKKKALNHLHHIESQIRGIQKMIDEEKGCINVITQLSVVRSSIDCVMGMIVAENLKRCFENPGKGLKEQRERLVQATNMIAEE